MLTSQDAWMDVSLRIQPILRILLALRLLYLRHQPLLPLPTVSASIALSFLPCSELAPRHSSYLCALVPYPEYPSYRCSSSQHLPFSGLSPRADFLCLVPQLDTHGTGMHGAGRQGPKLIGSFLEGRLRYCDDGKRYLCPNTRALETGFMVQLYVWP